MLVLLPLAAALLVHRHAVARGAGRGRAATLAAVWSAAWAVLLSELLGALRALTPLALAAGWAALVIALLLALRRSSGSAPARPEAAAPRERWPRWLACGLGLVGLVTLVLALASPPNTNDAMLYHLPRVEHWIQNRTLAHFPTSSLRQLLMGPGAELLVLQARLLTGGDRLTNLVQWSAFAGCVGVAALLARDLGGGRGARWAAALFAATVPMAVLQASGAKNDLVAAFFTGAFVLLGRRAAREASLGEALAAGAALGLALLTKSSTAFFAAPFAAGFAWRLVASREGRRRAPVLALAVVAPALVLGAGHAARNHALFGAPLGPPRVVEHFRAELHGPAAWTSGVVRHLALHAGLPSARSTSRVERGVERLHRWLGLSPDDPRTTMQPDEGEIRFRVPPATTSEALAGAPLHVVLGLIALVGALRRRGAAAHALGVVAGAALFATCLKWLPWHGRLHLPAFVLLAPAVGVVVDGLRWRRLGAAILLVLFAASTPCLLVAERRPLLGVESVLRRERWSLYFNARPGAEPSMTPALELLSRSGARRVGLVGPEERFFEYPVWVRLVQSAPDGRGPRIEHLRIENASAALRSDVPPDAVLAYECDPELAAELRRTVGQEHAFGRMAVFVDG